MKTKTTTATGTVNPKISIARRVTNQALKMAHTATLERWLKTFNYHYNLSKAPRTRQELAELVRVERNRILWGSYASA